MENKEPDVWRDDMAVGEAVRAILTENARRRARNTAIFDPISGRGSVGERFELYLDDFEIPRMWLPVQMRELPVVEGLVRCRNVRTYLSGRYGRPASDADMLRFADEFDRLRMLHDFPYWAAKYVYIKSKGGGEERLFTLNRPQRKFVETMERSRTAGKPIRILLLKARQWGGSTCSQIYMAWLQLVHRTGLNSLIIAHQSVASDEIMDMYARMMAGYPLRLLHEQDEKYKESERKLEGVGRTRSNFRVPQRKCKIKVGTAERPDSCRGGDYNLVHCSEVGLWRATPGKMPEHIVRSACSGVLLRPFTMIVYESTANGTQNFFHREYEAARRGQSQFEPLFVSWFDIDQYSAEIEDTAGFAQQLWEGRNSDAAADSRSQPGRYLWWLWSRGATLEAIAWYVDERRKYGEHAMMASEYPSDDVEAFVHSGHRVFDMYNVEKLRSATDLMPETGEIESRLEALHGRLPDNGYRRRRLETAEFRPLAGGGWKVWKKPDETGDFEVTERYVAVVDVGGRTENADWSVIAVFDREPMLRGEGPEIVAQWRGHTDFDILAWKAALGASFYGNALLVIESNTLETRDRDRVTDGDQSGFLLNRLRDVYPNLYARRRSEEDIRNGAPQRYGFHTNAATKPLIIATLVKMIREGLYTERDPLCLSEYLSYEKRQNGSFGAIAGCHDDLLMTRAIGLHICFHELPLPERHEKRPSDRFMRKPGSGMAAW